MKKLENKTPSLSKRALFRAAALVGFATGGLSANGAGGHRAVAQESFEISRVVSIPTTLELLSGTAPASATHVRTLGFRHVGDGGGATFLRLRASEHADDFEARDGSRWRLILDGGVSNIRQFGALGDGRRDDTAAIQQAVSLLRLQGGSVLYFPAGHYVVTGPVLHHDRLNHPNGLRVHGDGPAVSILKPRGRIEGFLFSVTGDTSGYGAPHASFIDFADFGVEGNGSDLQNVFSITCADRINFRNVHAFNCRGHGILAREWWDSECDVRFVRCGDDAIGEEKAVIDLDHFFPHQVADSGCNNLILPATVQIEAYRHRALRFGHGTRQNTISAKIHPDLSRNYTVPAVMLDGALANVFQGASIMHFNADGSHVYAVEINGDDYFAVRNRFIGCELAGGVTLIGNTKHNVVSLNRFGNQDQPAVLLAGGPDVLVRDNMCDGTGPEVSYPSDWHIHQTHIHQLRVGRDAPTDGWDRYAALHVHDPNRRGVALFESGASDIAVEVRDASSGRSALARTAVPDVPARGAVGRSTDQ